jgi:hypothetical protein
MGTLMRRKEAHHRYVPLVGFALFLTVLLLPQIAFARIFIQNHMEGSVAAPSAGPELYAYHQGDEASYDLEADFDLGTYDDTEVDATGTLLQIAAASAIDWWDTDWGARRCFDIMNGDTLLAEHQVRIVFDSTSDLAGGLVQADGADYRAIADDDVTQLPIFVESGVGTPPPPRPCGSNWTFPASRLPSSASTSTTPRRPRCPPKATSSPTAPNVSCTSPPGGALTEAPAMTEPSTSSAMSTTTW